ncbi:MAG: TonB-dependent receptor [Bacteroidota bacterium]
MFHSKWSFLIGLCLFTGVAQAQDFTISGYLTDMETGEELLYATVAVPSISAGVTTNEYGFYSLTLPAGNYEVVYSYVGYESQLKTVELQADQRIDLELSSGTLLEEVVVTSSQTETELRSTEMSTATLDMAEAKLVPVIFGEQDVLKTIQLLPGVSSGGDGNSGFFVRGGDQDQNFILLDEAPVYNASHLLGFFSVFNSDALKDVKLYKGGIPAQYGGRLSSVLDVRMKNGNSKSWSASGGIGLISSRLTVEGPIQEDKGSIILSGRRTYADLLLRAFNDDFAETSLYFYDLNAKANYKIGDKDRIYISGYFGEDVFQIDGAGLDWGNITGTLRWNHTFSDKLFSNTSFIYSDYNYGFGVDNAGTEIDLASGIFDYNLKQDYFWYPNINNSLQFGWNVVYHSFKPGDFTAVTDEETTQTVSIEGQQAVETGIYLDNEQKLGDKWSIYYGLRLSTFSNLGAYDVNEYNEEDEIINTTSYSSGEWYNTYANLEPRFSASYLLEEDKSIKFSANRMAQYLHLLSTSNSSSPTDIWIPSTPNVAPSLADQVAVGYFQNFADQKWEFSVEAYYKRLLDLVDYEDGAETFLNPDIEAELVFGEGRAYGAEFYLKKNTGKLTGWLSYTLSKSERQFDDINDGNWFSARQDRTNDLSIVAMYQLSPRWTLSSSFVYYTGDAVTFPVGKYEVDGETVTLYTERNGGRMPDYHRLDVGATWLLKDTDRYHSDLNFSIYNVYNQKNAFSIDFEENDLGETEAVKTYLFGIVPSVTWNFTFK